MEEFIPINVEKIKIINGLQSRERHNISYYNVIVKQCPPFIKTEKQDNYIRASPIKRLIFTTLANQEDVFIKSWPDHPRDSFNELIGAIIILKTLDEKILLVRNGSLWGLPKGARNYNAFLEIKNITMQHYLTTNDIFTIKECEFNEIESADDNICRETYEETGIKLDRDKLNLFNEKQICAYTRYYYNLDFEASYYIEILKENGTDHENDELSWISLKDLQEMLFKHSKYRHSKIFNHVTYSYLVKYFEFLKRRPDLNV